MATLLSYALCSLADVKESLGISSGDTSRDNLIIRKINQATAMIESYTGRRFALTTYTNEEYDATQTNQLILKQRPVVSFTAYGRRDTSLNEDDFDSIDTNLYFVDNNAGVIDGLFNSSGGWNKWRVTYTAGYATIPADIAEAAASLAAYLVENPVSGGSSVRSKEEGQRRIEYYQVGGTGGSASNGIFDILGITDIINSYCDMPILADK